VAPKRNIGGCSAVPTSKKSGTQEVGFVGYFASAMHQELQRISSTTKFWLNSALGTIQVAVWAGASGLTGDAYLLTDMMVCMFIA
jgi:hypothetical protein